MRRAAWLLLVAPAALTLMAATNPATETRHTVKAGETLKGIANRARVPLVVIAEANGLSRPYKVRKGQTLVIPRQRSHKIRRGETGYAIARKYGVPFSLIATANGLGPKGTVRTGQKLIIPAVLPANRPSKRPSGAPYFEPPHDGRVVLGYAVRPDGGGHDGLDYDANLGDMVRASASGTVIYAGREPKRFGRLVVIDHGDGWHSAYGHLSRITVSKGEVVKAGERVGLVGQAGVAAEPELHFEIRRNGKPVDPIKRLGRGG